MHPRQWALWVSWPLISWALVSFPFFPETTLFTPWENTATSVLKFSLCEDMETILSFLIPPCRSLHSSSYHIPCVLLKSFRTSSGPNGVKCLLMVWKQRCYYRGSPMIKPRASLTTVNSGAMKQHIRFQRPKEYLGDRTHTQWHTHI